MAASVRAGLLGLATWALSLQAGAFALEDVTAQAQALAAQPYVAPVSNLPDVFARMQFDDYQKMQPRRDQFEWAGQDTPFRLAFYHQGMQFNTPVRISEVVGDAVQEIPYDPARFDFGDLHFDREQTRNLGWAGFRVLYPINQPGKDDEIMSVLGASYFRVIGKGQIYGLSSRGLAIDTGLPVAEEFPRFREFWIRRPAPQDRQLTIYALMDSPRATGAYELTLTPGADSVLDVKARVFLRADPAKLGVAPLTSMFLFGPSQPSATYNYRPAIHDSNGLAIHAGNGEWIWRPLSNPQRVAVSSYATENPKGFGLLQRGREFSRFEDLKDRYDLRPSAWIEPQNDWGRGRVELIEIPTADETNDNIVAYWAPDARPAPGQPLQLDYRMHWTMNEPGIFGADPISWVKQTLRTTGERYQANLIRQSDGTLALLVDFEGPSLKALPPDAAVTAQVSASANVDVASSELQRNPATQGWRLTYRVHVKDPTQVSELRAALVLGDRVLTETWSYQLPPVIAPPSSQAGDVYLNRFKMVQQ
ncbi:MAG: Glucans biosynthesis protein G [Paracidovorax wautersii]|uniref:Glucans biosynthesis protein G n=1 Tax=Paracidovorax wautersii TaxID=1177982 RepID=A0A7V8FKK5_9BURK|nr:MAG: Glucans biosynthesis protein G [Paracidovorax wautersii]